MASSNALSRLESVWIYMTFMITSKTKIKCILRVQDMAYSKFTPFIMLIKLSLSSLEDPIEKDDEKSKKRNKKREIMELKIRLQLYCNIQLEESL